MRYVYLIGNHHEYGSENLRATLDRSRVLELWASWASANGFAGDEYAESHLKELLQQEDTELCGDNSPHNLSDWGGPQLHVVELME